ncbi:MAG TPA: hypothetical protein VIK64_04295 [Anaerolineales bacterium]
MPALLLAACARATLTPSPTAASMGEMGKTTTDELAPLVTGFYDGGEVASTRPGIMVNMPILSWPGGHR